MNQATLVLAATATLSLPNLSSLVAGALFCMQKSEETVVVLVHDTNQ